MLKTFFKKTLAVAIIASAMVSSIALSASAATLYGDANGDGTVDSRDVVRMKKHVADNTIPINLEAVDDDENGKIAASDIVVLRNILLGDASYSIDVIEGEINWPDSWDN